MPVDEHGDEYDEDWEPDNPVLRGETQQPDHVPETGADLPDELPHRERVARGLHDEDPDPGYDPDGDDLEVSL